MTARPFFSVITPVYCPAPAFLAACVESVVDQTLEDWELVLVDDGNDSVEILDLLASLESRHAQVRVVHSSDNLGIAGASQLGLEYAVGTFVGFLDHDDLLAPIALQRMSEAIELRSDVDYLYSDEDKIDETGALFHPFFKPDWSPERFRAHMYTCHFSVVRRTVALDVGGFREGFDGAQDYDFVLRVTERARRVVHVPEILYHWRAHLGSTALDAAQKPTAFPAARRALEEHCSRVGIDAEVSDSVGTNTYRVRRNLASKPLISLIIPTNGKVTKVRGRDTMLIAHLVTGIEAQTTYENFEYVFVHDAQMSAAALATVRDVCAGRPHVMVPYDYNETGFNFSRAVNQGAIRSSGELLLLLNDDMELITPDWLEELASIVVDPDVGAVGGKYYFEDDTIQHAGVVCAGGPIHLGYRLPRGTQLFGFHFTVAREVSALTGACLIVDREDFFNVAGFTELLPNNFNDVDFCFKLRALGRRNVWTPYVEMYHFETKTRANTVHGYETDLLTRRWGDRLGKDPYYNPNLISSPPLWEPFHDWREFTRDWPRTVRHPGELDTEAYLERNPDLAEAVHADPAWDLLEHFVSYGMSEGRIQSVKRPRHPDSKTVKTEVPR